MTRDRATIACLQ